jgi:prepilin-type N-terminal cleavage/methylation domain-containing protein
VNKTSKNAKAFSMIELLIVIVIIGILASTAIPSYTKYLQRASITEAVAVMGEYKTALAVFWSTLGRMPTTGDILISTPADLPFNTLVTNELPNSIQSVILNNNGNGLLFTVILKANIFATYPQNNRTLSLGVKSVGNELFFVCGNQSTNATSTSDVGFVDITVLPMGCNYNGVAAWLSM